MKISFLNDYSEGAHPEIINKLSDTNLFQTNGYGEDIYCESAATKIKNIISKPDAKVHFVSGGTQANLLCISSFLKPYESVVTVKTAHIEVHEAGAIEYTGHKINSYDGVYGKITPNEIIDAIEFHYDEHMVRPKLVFISNSTELGTIYSKKELIDIFEVCKKNNLLLYLDGARLGAALCSEYNDIQINELSKFCDVFYIGGTKNGALIGEAIVINNPELQNFFRYNMKQKGALLAKSRLLGIQFDVLFSNNLYFELAHHANKMANILAEGIKNKGFNFYSPPQTNQIFPIFPNSIIGKLSKSFDFYMWKRLDDNNSVIRLVCSWATKETAIDKFINEI